MKFEESDFIDFLNQTNKYKLWDTQAKTVIDQLINTGDKVEEIIHRLWFDEIVDIDYDNLADQVITSQDKVVQDYKGGKLTAIWFLVWQLMKLSGGKADPNQAKQVLELKLLS